MVDDDLEHDILMTIVNNHSHDSSSMLKEDLIDKADGGRDHDSLEEAIDEVIDSMPFLAEWGHHRDERIHLDQSTGEVVDYLVEEHNENPAWLKPELSHVPPDTWNDHGV